MSRPTNAITNIPRKLHVCYTHSCLWMSDGMADRVGRGASQARPPRHHTTPLVHSLLRKQISFMPSVRNYPVVVRSFNFIYFTVGDFDGFMRVARCDWCTNCSDQIPYTVRIYIFFKFSEATVAVLPRFQVTTVYYHTYPLGLTRRMTHYRAGKEKLEYIETGLYRPNFCSEMR